MKSRELDFRGIGTALKQQVRLNSEHHLVVEGDSLEVLRKIPDNSISLILTDPPYHATKKKNIYGDTQFAKDNEYLDWMAMYAVEWRRILKPNGSLFCYCDSSMSARLEVLFSEQFNILSHVVWTKPNAPGFDGWKGKMKKENLRQWYGHSERIIFAEPAQEGNLHRSPFGQYLREKRTASGLSGHQLTEMTGAYGKVNHGGAVSNWEAGRNTPSRDQYSKICTAILSTGKVDSMLPYEDIIRPFIIDGTKEFTDVWNFESVRPYKGKHPAEKPIDMLKHAIAATTYSDDIVLDCFGGSGSTAVAARLLNRKSVTIEIESDWVESIVNRLTDLEVTVGSALQDEETITDVKLRVNS
ncbi:DNA-methyltransferase [Vibrio campbellii]|uniref:DNA-methyltransferase n=1 Tax=Photobacterium ganghwense TaxID=320778 RepID=UPI004056BE13